MKVIFIPDYRKGNPYQELLANSLSKFGVKVNFGNIFPIFSMLRNAKKYWKPDILHIHWQHPFLLSSNKWKTILKSTSFICKLILLKLLGIKIVWTVHNIVNHERRFSSIELFFSKILARLCDKLIVHCPSAKEEVMKVYGIGNSSIAVIPHGKYNYENRMSREQARKMLQLDSSDFVFLYFGQIRPYKGVYELIDAFKMLGNAKAQLLIVGNPYDKDIVIKNRSENKNIKTILKFVPNEEIQIYMNAADIVVIPYKEILTSGAVILAMSFGKPVIAPKMGCISDILNEKGGFLYQGEDGLLEAMKTALNTSEEKLNKMGKYNFKLAERLNWNSIAENTYEIYKELKVD